jgi:two-component system cell cycle sensor histidine kinase/response regulator CckA
LAIALLEASQPVLYLYRISGGPMDFTPMDATTEQRSEWPDRELLEGGVDYGSEESSFRELVRLSPFSIFSTDPAGRYRFVNKAWCRLTALPASQATGDGWLAAIHKDDRQRVRYEWTAAVGAGTGFRCEYRLANAPGGVRWVRKTASPSRSAIGLVKGFLGTLQDLGEGRSAEGVPRAPEPPAGHVADSLHSGDERKLEHVGVLAAGLAHDFNNLLSVVLGGTCIARDALPEDHSAQAFLKMVHDAANRGADLTRQLLAYSGRGQFFVESVDLAEIVRETAAHLRPSVPPDIELLMGLPAEVPRCPADRAQIQQMLRNVLENAVEAIGPCSGTIRLDLRVANLREGPADPESPAAPPLARGDYLVIAVSDTGCGMDESTLARIFDPFFTTKFIGRGLGLSAVEGIVRGHKGSIQVRSQVGRGSVFEIHLPLFGTLTHVD